MKFFKWWKKKPQKIQKVPVTTSLLLMARAAGSYDYGDSCILYGESYDRGDSCCRGCYARTPCRVGTELLDSIAIMSHEKLPEFLVHKREKIRIAANKRLTELYD